MEIIYIAGFIIAAAAITVAVRNSNKEVGMLVAVAVCVVTVIAILPSIRQFIDILTSMSTKAALGSEKLEPLLKATGIAIITEFSSDLCRDSGENAMAKQIELVGKVLILLIALPLAQSLLNVFTTLIKG